MNKFRNSKWKINRAIQNNLNDLTLLRASSNLNVVNNNVSISSDTINNATQSVNTEVVHFSEETMVPVHVQELVVCESNQLNNFCGKLQFSSNSNKHENLYDEHFNEHNKPLKNVFNNITMSEQVEKNLKFWAVKNRITHSALKELLQILCCLPDLKNIPNDPRTFLGTPRSIVPRVVNPGSYFHLGIANGLNKMFQHVDSLNVPDCIEVGINIDGLPLFKSSSSQLYPILCIVNNVKIQPNIFPIGVYHGSEKPNNFNDFLRDFVTESSKLSSNGLFIKNKHIQFKIKMFLFDAVAKASILFIKGHSGYSSCTKCTQEGEYLCSRVCFPDVNFNKRTDFDFIAKTDVDHHVGRSILEEIPGIRPVTDVPLDYMHLICLGVVKKFVVSTWCFGRPPHKLAAIDINTMSNTLISFSKFVPVEFARGPRSLKESKRWKATEFRQFILYTGPIVLKNILDDTKYKHFLSLHVAIIILLSDNYKIYIDYADKLLNHFVSCVKLIYGPEFLTHNIHNLLHITDDVKEFGNMNLFSNFPAENYLQKLKKLVRKTHLVLPQVIRRLSEENALQLYSINETPPRFKLEKERVTDDGILIPGTTNPQYRVAIFPNFKLTLGVKNSCCKLKCNLIIEIFNFAFSPTLNQNIVIGKKYDITEDFYEKPCKSSMLGIYYVNNLNNEFNYWLVSDICYKMARFPYKSGFVVFPLLHTID